MLATEDHRTDECNRNFLPDCNIRCAANDAENSFSYVNAANCQFVGVGMLADFQHLPDYEVLVSIAQAFDALYFQPLHRESGGDDLGRNPEIYVLFKPSEGYAHKQSDGLVAFPQRCCARTCKFGAKNASELFQESDVVLKKDTDIIDAIPQQRNPFDAHPKRIAAVLFYVVAD